MEQLGFDIQDIMDLANESSYEKGAMYYRRGYVGNITRDGRHFQGVVTGNEKYIVELDNEDDDLDFSCSCPYDFGGICKHEVALALAILDGKFAPSLEMESKIETIMPNINFDETFDEVASEEKVKFLRQLLSKDRELKQQFITFIQSKHKDLDIITGEDIDTIKENICDELSSIDFDDFVENFYEYNDEYSRGYYNEDGWMDGAYDMVKNILKKYLKPAYIYYQKGNAIDAIRIILGVYEGVDIVDDIESDNYSLFDEGYRECVLEFLKDELEDLDKNTNNIVISDEQIYRIIDTIDERLKMMITYNFKILENMIFKLLANSDTAEYLLKFIKKNKLDKLDLAFVIIKISEILKDDKLWLDISEKYASFDKIICRNLLERYKSDKNKTDFLKYAHIAFENWSNDFDFYLIKNLDKEYDKEFYINALKNYTKNKGSVNHYIELRDYLNEEEKILYVNDIGKGYSYDFYISLLEIEKRYEDILIFVKKNQAQSNYGSLIRPILNIYPDECFEIIKKTCDLAMNSYNRNRNTYHWMAGLLLSMTKIESKKAEVQNYLSSLFHYKPNLPALKDEFRKMGLDKWCNKK